MVARREKLPRSLRGDVADGAESGVLAERTPGPCGLGAAGGDTAGRDPAAVGNAEAVVPQGVWG